MQRRDGGSKTIVVTFLVCSTILLSCLPIGSAKVDYQRADEIDSGTSTKFLDVSWNPCGSEALIVGEGGMVMLYTDHSLDKVPSGTTMQLSAVAWKPDCTYALIAGASNTVLKYEGGKITALNFTDASGTLSLLQDITWTTDGAAVMSAGRSGLLWYKDGSFWRQPLPAGSEDVEVFGLAWRPQGDYGLVVGQKKSVFRFTTTSIEELTVPGVIEPTTSFYGMGWQGDGSSASIVGQKGTILEWDGTKFLDPPIHGGAGSVNTFLDVDWRPNGDFSLVTGDTGTLLAHAGGPENFPYIPSSGVYGTLYAVDWSPDGSNCLIVGQSGIILIYPGKEKKPDGPTWNPVALGGILVIGVIILLVAVVYYIEDRRSKRKKERDKRSKRRSRRRRKGRRSH